MSFYRQRLAWFLQHDKIIGRGSGRCPTCTRTIVGDTFKIVEGYPDVCRVCKDQCDADLKNMNAPEDVSPATPEMRALLPYSLGEDGIVRHASGSPPEHNKFYRASDVYGVSAAIEARHASHVQKLEEKVRILEYHMRVLGHTARQLKIDLILAETHLGVARTDTPNVWFWQGNGKDDLPSLACPVVMSAETLRAMHAQLETDQLYALRCEVKGLRAELAAKVCGTCFDLKVVKRDDGRGATIEMKCPLCNVAEEEPEV